MQKEKIWKKRFSYTKKTLQIFATQTHHEKTEKHQHSLDLNSKKNGKKKIKEEEEEQKKTSSMLCYR